MNCMLRPGHKYGFLVERSCRALSRQNSSQVAILRRMRFCTAVKPAGGSGGGEKKIKEFVVDRTGMLGYARPPIEAFAETATGPEVPKETPSPLTKDLQSLIRMRGPVTLYEFMAQALNHSVHGYYQHKEEKIGSEGDFVTSPEISQLFGEMVGVWCFSAWDALGRPPRLRLLEMGPGKGTLIKDILRVSEQFPAFRAAAEVHLVELSNSMRKLQRDALGATPVHTEGGGAQSDAAASEDRVYDDALYETAGGVRVTWHSFLKQVPDGDGVPLVAVGQEFLDAFPVHQFLFTKHGWREKLVDVDEGSHSPLHFRAVLAAGTTPAVATLLSNKVQAVQEALLLRQQRLQSESPLTARETKLVLPVVGKQDFQVRREDDGQAAREQAFADAEARFKVGDGLELCPLAIATCEDLAARVVRSGGAALLVDYGEDFTQEDSIRGFRRHQQVSYLSEPGRVDVTADVDFALCRRAAVNRGAEVLPLSTQGDFLMRMGIVERVEALLDREATTEEEGEALVAGLSRLVDPAEMGRKYKVMAIVSPRLKVFGFDSQPSATGGDEGAVPK